MKTWIDYVSIYGYIDVWIDGQMIRWIPTWID